MGSTVTIKTQNRNSLFLDYENNRIFVNNNRFESGNIAASGADLELTEGTLIGRIASTGKLAVMKSASIDGSQLPIGVLLGDITIADGSNADINICVAGDVVKDRLVFDGTDDLDTTITTGTNIDQTYFDLIQSNSVGIKLISAGDNLTGFDNQ